MRLEPLTLDQSWQHRLAATFKCMVEVLIEDGFYRTHLCEDYNCQACNILRWAHLPKCECKTKWHFRFRICYAVKTRYCACFFRHPHVLQLYITARQGSGWLVPWLGKGIKSLVARNSVE
jgi:hypothetical protein